MAGTISPTNCAPNFSTEETEDDHTYQGRYFWPAEARDRVLARLLALNAERHAEEVAAGRRSRQSEAFFATRMRTRRSWASTSIDAIRLYLVTAIVSSVLNAWTFIRTEDWRR